MLPPARHGDLRRACPVQSHHHTITKLVHRAGQNPTESKVEPGTILSIGSRDSFGASAAVRSGRKHCPSEQEEGLDTTDSESSNESADELESNQCKTIRVKHSLSPPSEALKQTALKLADQALPSCSQWIASARYIRPPEYRIPPRKRRMGQGTPPSLLMETQDPDDPSTILIQRVDGCFHLACPLFVSNPTRYESCPREHSIRSIEELFHHLENYHPHPIYCPVCGQFFDDEFARDRHIRALSCVARNFLIEKGVTRTQLGRMAKKDNRNRHEEERWRRIYQVLFPEAEKPPRESAYLQEVVPLALSMARDYWDTRGRGIVDEYLQGRVLEGGWKPDEREVLVLFELAGTLLVRRVAEDAGKDQNGVLKSTEEVAEEEWEAMKPERY
jgi:hypothetical protein